MAIYRYFKWSEREDSNLRPLHPQRKVRSELIMAEYRLYGGLLREGANGGGGSPGGKELPQAGLVGILLTQEWPKN